MAKYHSRALAHSDGECIKCGLANEQHNDQHGRNLDVHHIDGDSSNNQMENLAVLCRDCHRRVHYGREGYEDLHDKLPESKQWTQGADEWKTLRVPADAYLEAKQQKEKHSRTWGEQLTHGIQSERDAPEIDDILGRIDDIESNLPRRIIDELEGRRA